MAAPRLSYTKTTHTTTYPSITPTQPNLSNSNKVVLITGASGGIGRATASSFAASNPRALVLLGRRADALSKTEALVRAKYPKLVVQTYQAELCDAPSVRSIMNTVAGEFDGIDIVVHCAGVLALITPLLEANPSTFLEGYKTTILGTLVTAQSVVLASKNKPLTFINLTTAGILFPPFPGMGAYVSSKTAALKLLQCFAAENPHVRMHHVHPGFLETEMSRQLGEKIKLPFGFDGSEHLPSLANMSAYIALANVDGSFSPGRLPRVDRLAGGRVPAGQDRLRCVGCRRTERP